MAHPMSGHLKGTVKPASTGGAHNHGLAEGQLVVKEMTPELIVFVCDDALCRADRFDRFCPQSGFLPASHSSGARPAGKLYFSARMLMKEPTPQLRGRVDMHR
ncbi:hypothetical protein CJ179_00090 [Rhodococcus sp. ACS1]|uniref:hypothetical protein n=1 Tax=Rhodococcus sp. ACS1 TaxID=2028570 RepID=UPI000BB123D8|nr:hypothetical protein [Rhodococcus sp. ACS1]PBC51863.1 hypothetical protein CJ179_00090 [Rhodococcus sp. ACS1]